MRPTPLSLTAACLIALTAPSADLLAQATPPLTPGTRVRLTAPALNLPDREEGRVLALRRDTLDVRLEGISDSLALPLAYVTTLEVSPGRHSAVGKGVFLGLITGGLLGALVGAQTYHPCDCINLGRGWNAGIGGVIGGLAGMVVGGVIGAHGRETWEPVHLGRTRTESRLGLSLRLPSGARTGPGLSLALRF